MKAIICTKYGSPSVLQLKEVDKPSPKTNEVLVKIKSASVTTADGMMRKGSPYIGRLFIGLMKPKYPVTGTGFAGEIEAIGKNVTFFKNGDQVFGESIFGLGTNAEYVCIPEDGVITLKPNSLSHEEAAPVCDGALTSLNFLRDMAKIKAGQNVLIIGASGSLGTAAIQLAKYFGTNVTGICSTQNLSMVKAIGADTVIDYTKDDFTQINKSYDIIFDTLGKHSFSDCKSSLTKKGIYLSPVLDISLLFQMLWTSVFSHKKAMFSATGIRPAPELKTLLNELKIIFEAGKINSIIDKRYSLEQTADAHSYVELGHKKGNVVLILN